MTDSAPPDSEGPRSSEEFASLDTGAQIGGDQTIMEFLTEEGYEGGVDLQGGKKTRKSNVLRVKGGKKYDLGPEIARGGMGIIYEARELNSRRTVALKVLPRELSDPEKDLLRFIREGQLTSQLEHPNIVPLHEMGQDERGNVYYTMKYVKGRTLTSIILDIRKGVTATIDEFPLARLLNIFQKVCDAVAFAHSKGVIHRDLKPDNVMVGSYGEVQVMDWGLAKVLQEIPAEQELANRKGPKDTRATDELDMPGPTPADDFGSTLQTLKGRIMGTPGFMAPEQVFVGEAKLNKRSDIYSLGAILYSLLTLHPTVPRGEVTQVLRKIVSGDIRPPVSYNEIVDGDRTSPGETHAGLTQQGPFAHCPDGWIPTALSNIAMCALATEPEDRHATVQELQKELEDYQNGYVWHVVIDEDFSDENVLSRWDIYGGQFEISDGELRIHDGEPQVMILKRDVPGDVRIEFECRIESDYLNCIACFMNAFRADNFMHTLWSGYEFEYGGYDNSRNVVHRFNEQTWIEPDTPLKKGEHYHVIAERFGSRLTFTVNGKEILSMTDPDPISGSNRVAVGFLGWLTDVRYSRIKISTLGTPWKGDVLDVAERQIQKGRYEAAIGLFCDTLESFPDAERRARAERGLDLAGQRFALAQGLPEWNAQLKKAWPDIDARLQVVNDGLSFDISYHEILDLSPLAGLPINVLYCAQCGIKSLEPLRRMPLTALNCLGNPITELDPLEGMPLRALLCEDCPISDLEPLRGMPLRSLQIGMNKVSDLDPLRGMPLITLDCWSGEIESLEPLRGMGLDSLNCSGNRITSLEPLRGMHLTNLNCSGNRIEDLSPVNGMPLTILGCCDNNISSLMPLEELPLTLLVCNSNRITDLSPLKHLALAALTCGDNPLTGLGPMVDTPPDEFLYHCDTISDEEYERILGLWGGRPEYAQHAGNIRAILAFRARDVKKMKKLAGRFEGHRYFFIPHFARWEEAKALCEELGGHLLTVMSKEEDDFVTSLFKAGCRFWMGLYTKENGTSEWVTGEPCEYHDFLSELCERIPGPKVYSRLWRHDYARNPHNCFMIKWE